MYTLQNRIDKTTNMQKKQIDDNTAMKDFINEKIKILIEKDKQLRKDTNNSIYAITKLSSEEMRGLEKRMKILEMQYINLHDTYAKSILEPVKPIRKSFDGRKWVTKKLDR